MSARLVPHEGGGEVSVPIMSAPFLCQSRSAGAVAVGSFMYVLRQRLRSPVSVQSKSSGLVTYRMLSRCHLIAVYIF